MTATAERKEKPLQFVTALVPEASCFSLENNYSKKVAHLGRMNIPVHDVISENGKGGIHIRYMANQPSIYKIEQEKNGVPTDYGTNKNPRNRTDQIIMLNGEIQAIESTEANKVEYLMKTDYNGSKPDRDKSKMILFYFNDVEKKAKDIFSKNKAVDKAKSMVLDLEGNTRKLGEVALLFNLDTNNIEEMLLNQLTEIAEKDPERIMSAIKSDKDKATVVAMQAQEQNLISFDGHKWIFTQAGDKILGFQGRIDAQLAFKKLVTFLQSDDGQVNLAQVTELVEAKAKADAIA